MNAAAGDPPGSPWCVAFIYFCAKQAAVELNTLNPLPQTGSASRLFDYSRAMGRLAAAPQPGDIGLCRGGETGHYHAVLVATLPVAGRVETIEGNSNQEGGPEGFEVVHRAPGRPVGSMDFVRF